jgi:putative phosphoesterase
MRIGLISDTHIPTAARHLWPQIYDAFRGESPHGPRVDLIMHAGDLMVSEVIDWLEEVAPVMAVWGNGDFGGWERTVPPEDPRLSEAKVLVVRSEEQGARSQRDGDAGSPSGHLAPGSSILAPPVRIGLVHDLQMPEHPPLRTLEGQMRHYFGGPVDVIVRGSTHAAEITTVKGVLIVNPGSPTFPNHANTRLGTIGFLEVEDGRVEARVVQLE